MSEGQDQKENAAPKSRQLWTYAEDDELRTDLKAGLLLS